MSSLGEIPVLAPQHTSEQDTFSSASSGQKRQRDGSPARSTAFSESAKTLIRTRTNTEECWLCESPTAQFAHVTARAEPAYRDLISKGMLTLPLDDYRNCIMICPTCHSSFDRTSKNGWIFLPTDLAFFIEWEEADWRQRRDEFDQTRRRLNRTFPDERAYEKHIRSKGELIEPDDGLCRGGLYNRYILERMFSPIMMNALEQQGLTVPGKYPASPKRWHGTPMAAINRGFVVLGAPWRKLPSEEWKALRTLQDLYTWELPQSVSGNLNKTVVQGLTSVQAQRMVGRSVDAGIATRVSPATHQEGLGTSPATNRNSNQEYDSGASAKPLARKRGWTQELDGAATYAEETGRYGNPPSKKRNRCGHHLPNDSESISIAHGEQLDVHADFWSFGPKCSSEDKIFKHTGKQNVARVGLRLVAGQIVKERG